MFTTHAFQYVLMRYPENITRLKSWLNNDKFAVRRSASVILIRPAQKGLLNIKIIFEICDLSILDSHHLVQKGLGGLLKESCNKYHDEVIEYLKKNYNIMSRTAFRYALEKLPKEEKNILMCLLS